MIQKTTESVQDVVWFFTGLTNALLCCSLRVSGELPSVSFRLSDVCLIGLIELVKSIKLPAAPEVTFDEIQQFRVSQSVCYPMTVLIVVH